MFKRLLASFSALLFFCNAFAENGKPMKKSYLRSPDATALTDSVARPKPEFSVSNAVSNSYYWRGFEFNEGVMVQPSIAVSYGNWYASTWSNVVALEAGPNEFVPEVDVTLGYGFENGNWGFSPQANLFFYPSNSTDVATVEIGAELTYQTPTVGFYVSPNFDIANNDGGIYVDYGLTKSGEIGSKWSYDAMFLLGWGNKRFRNFYEPPVVVETIASYQNLKEESLKSMRIQATANYQASDRFSIHPQLIAFRNFMTEYTFRHDLVRFNGSLTCAYAF